MLQDSKHTFAIGDVHGCAELLDELLDAIRIKALQESLDYRVVFLGDIIDRGPDSRAAMDLVVATLRDVPGSKLVLGNHESLLLRAIDGDDFAIYGWRSQGGDETLRSYGMTGGAPVTSESIRDTIGAEHLECMAAAEHYVELDHHILVHAGVRPGIAIGNQTHHDLMWIRDGFIDCVESFGKIVIHGHTPNRGKSVEIWPNRIAVDTWAYETDILSAVQVTPTGEIFVMQAEAIGGILFETVLEDAQRMNWEAVMNAAGFKLEIKDGLAIPGAPLSALDADRLASAVSESPVRTAQGKP